VFFALTGRDTATGDDAAPSAVPELEGVMS
jgi:hypothetical protein